MNKFTRPISIVIALTLLTGTITAHVQDPLSDHDDEGRIPIPAVQFNANNSSAMASTSFVVVQDAITDADYDATPLKKPDITQG